MAILQIEEYGVVARFGIQVPKGPPTVIQRITLGGSSTSAANPIAANYIRLVATGQCAYKLGFGAQTAADDATSVVMVSGQVVDLEVAPGQTIAAITSAS